MIINQNCDAHEKVAEKIEGNDMQTHVEQKTLTAMPELYCLGLGTCRTYAETVNLSTYPAMKFAMYLP